MLFINAYGIGYSNAIIRPLNFESNGLFILVNKKRYENES